MAFQARDTSRYFQQAQPQGSPLDSILPILISIIGSKAKGGGGGGTASMVDTYLDLSAGGTGVEPPAVAATASAATPAIPPLVQPTAPPLKQLTRMLNRPGMGHAGGCRIDPKTGRRV